jgi:hypothetical protein
MGVGKPKGSASVDALNRETLLDVAQLSDEFGVLGATVLTMLDNPATGDLIVITNGTTTRTYGAENGGDANYSLGDSGPPMYFPLVFVTMDNLADAINGDGQAAWTAIYLDDYYFGPESYNVVAIIEKDNTVGASKIYGTWVTQDNCKIGGWGTTNDYTSKDTLTLPSSEPEPTNFGRNRIFEDLKDGEIHYLLHSSELYAWSDSDEAWSSVGQLTVDTDRGLQLTDGVLALHVNSDQFVFDFGTGSMGILGVPNKFKINNIATSAAVTAANLDTLTNGSDADVGPLHTHGVGYVAAATINISDALSGTETITIGADVYEWDGAGSNINVTIGVDHAASRANLETAINGSGTEDVVADDDGMLGATTVRIQAADAPGGNPVIGVGPSIALSEGMGAGGNVWNMTNLNEVGSPAYVQTCRGKIVVGAQMLLGTGTLYQEFPFTVGVLEWQAYDSSGTPKPNTVTITSFLKVVGWSLTAGGSPLAATDYIVFTVYGE